MWLSDTSVTRPVFATVVSLLLIAFGLVAFDRLPLREYPDIDPPIVSISTNYSGAAATIVEARVTQVIENRISGVEGIKYISSSSEDGRSRITIEFDVNRDIEAAANDLRDRVSRVLDNLPEEADPPEVQKSDSSDDVIFWLALTSERMSSLELTDYARRYLEDRFSILPGVASVRIGGGLDYSMRVWIDRKALAARKLTVTDIESALRSENVELPAGDIESVDRQFTVRLQRTYRTPEDFRNLVIANGDNGYLVRLGDVATVEKAPVEDRTMFRGNGKSMVGLGIIKQSKANTIAVVDAVKAEAEYFAQNLPEGVKLEQSYDTSVFIRSSIHEVYVTLGIAVILVVLVIYAFLGSVRATLIPAVTLPVSLIATSILLYAFDYSVNLLTLLAVVVAIGLVVDDAIVVLENIYRRMEEGETPLVAAYHGTRQVGFAVLATTIVLVAIFVPITFLEGDLGRLFSEFAMTVAVAVLFSMLVALTLCPMLASKILKSSSHNPVAALVDRAFNKVKDGYAAIIVKILSRASLMVAMVVVFFGILAGSGWLYTQIKSEYAPKEDRGVFIVNVTGPEGASFSYMKEYMEEIEKRLLTYVESGEVKRVIMRAPGGFGSAAFNSGVFIVLLNDWGQRRSAFDIMDEVRGKLSDLSGVRINTVMRQGFGGGASRPVQFVIGGGTYDELAKWRDIIVAKINENNPGFVGIDSDYKETKPQLNIVIDKNRAGDLGVSVTDIGRTLETMLGSRRVTTYIEEGEEYDVIIEGTRDAQRTPSDIQNIYVRSDKSGQLIPLSSLVKIEEFADSNSLNRYNRIRSITLTAGLEDDYTLGEALKHLEGLVREHLPETAVMDYKGESLNLKRSGGSLYFVFMLGLAVVFLVLAAQFESFVHPLVIMLTVPLAIAGALGGLWWMDNSLNVYTQIGLIALVGLASKNGILIVEFINQLRDQGVEFKKAVVEASALRLRPIIMTSVTAVAGAIPLVLASGAGAETRIAIGIVIAFGVAAATIFTIFIIPVAYTLLARGTGSPGDVRRRLEAEEKKAGL